MAPKRLNQHRLLAAREQALVALADGWEPGGFCGHPLVPREGVRVPHPTCRRQAGSGTDHPDVGYCAAHGGNSRFERARAGFLMAHGLAGQLDVTPWEALLRAVRTAAGQAAWYDAMIAGAPDDEAVKPGGTHWPWVQGSERMHLATARYAKMAIDAGVQRVLVERVQVQAQQLAGLVTGVLDELEDEVPAELLARVRGRLRVELTRLDGGGWLDQTGHQAGGLPRELTAGTAGDAEDGELP